MKITLTLICTIFLCRLASAQAPAATGKPADQLLFEKYNEKYYRPIFVVDEKAIDDNQAKSTLDDIDPGSVTKVLIAHGTRTQPRDVVYVTTGRTKIRAYQEKLGKFSKAYVTFLKSHKYWDGKVVYLLNGKGVSGSVTNIIDVLYNLPAGQIKDVTFSEGDAFDWAIAT